MTAARWMVGLWAAALATVLAPATAQTWTAPTPEQIQIPTQGDHPLVAATAAELARLNAAREGLGAARRVATEVIHAGERALERDLVFPARGGQHNQWYQCRPCQRPLETIGDFEHHCPKCEKTYRGAPYDDVVMARQHRKNLRDAYDLALAFALTGETRFADRGARILLGYAGRYAGYAYHDNRLGTKSRSGGHLLEQTLSEASLLASHVAPALDLLRRALSPKHRQQIEDGLIRPMLANLDKHKAGRSNWQTWHNAAMAWGGAVLGDATWIAKAIHQEKNGFLFQMDACVSAEGMWYENSWAYHFYTLQALASTAEACRRIGIDLWGHPALRKMFTLPVACCMSDGSLPRFGDDVTTRIDTRQELYEAAYHAWRDPVLLLALPASPHRSTILLGRDPGASPPDFDPPSAVFEGTGHAILRTNGPADLSAAFAFGPFGGFHGHFDRLGFVLFGGDHEIAVDPGRARSQAYRLPIHRDWYRATLSHNTVVVDQRSQRGVAGELTLFAATKRCGAVAARVDQAYDGVVHERLLVLTPDYLVVFDQLQADRDRRFDWLYHGRGGGISCVVPVDAATWAADYPGVEYIEAARRGTTDHTVRATFLDDFGWPRVLVAGAQDTVVTTGFGVGASTAEQVPLLMVTRRGDTARFAAVVVPPYDEAVPRVQDVHLGVRDNRVEVTIERDGRSDRVRFGPTGVSVSLGGEVALIAERRAR